MVFLCTRKLNDLNFSVREMIKCSSVVPKVVHRVKFISWHSTNREWPIGRFKLLQTVANFIKMIWNTQNVIEKARHYSMFKILQFYIIYSLDNILFSSNCFIYYLIEKKKETNCVAFVFFNILFLMNL